MGVHWAEPGRVWCDIFRLEIEENSRNVGEFERAEYTLKIPKFRFHELASIEEPSL